MKKHEFDETDDDSKIGSGTRLRLLNERGVTVDEETEYDSYTRAPVCSVTCCGFIVGALTLAAAASAILFIVLAFGISYTGLDAGLCAAGEIGIGKVCIACPKKNATPDEAMRACRNIGAELARFGVIKALVDRLIAFSPDGVNDFMSVARMSESATTCVRATASGASSIDCPPLAAAVCQRPRPLGPLQESIRRTRIVMGAEPEDFYAKHAYMFADSANL